MFTDGLVERRPTAAPATDGDGDGDQIGAGLQRLLAALRPGSADMACTTVLTDLVGEDIVQDDVALLVLRRV
jgi:hypothetical protein